MLDSEELRWTEPNDAPEEGTLVAGFIDPSDHVADFDTGAKLGRYVVLSHMGTGAMGVVYAAYDPQLDRRIALKLMHPARTGDDPAAIERASGRMLAEAKAMAQLSHPNVITVHDVGTIDGRVFIAMEFVEGVPLSTWMREPGRDWREQLEVFIRAGRGLEAAHAAGLVHRDFKPDNVLVGVDGRVRVLDFGLARRFDGQLDGRDREAGTPAYMSPEQHLGKPLDHRADQFSFCVALYEALYGELPFAAKTRLQLALAVTDGRVGPAPKRASVPNWVRWALLRGLDPDPDGRWENMAALLEALSSDPYQRTRRLAAGGGAAVVVIVLLILLVRAGLANSREHESSEPERQCTAGADRVAEVWNDERRLGMREAQVGEPVDAIEQGFDQWALSWAQMHQQTCEATARGEQSDTMLDRRMLCLDRRLAEFDGLIEVMTGPAAQTLAREAIGKLPELRTCERESIEAGLDSGGDVIQDEQQREALDQLEGDLYRANLEVSSGTFAEVERLANVDRARELGNHRLLAKALLIRARLARAQGRLGSVAPLLEEAALEAERAGDDRLRGEVLIALARSHAELGDAEAATRRIREARAVLDRISLHARGTGLITSFTPGTGLITSFTPGTGLITSSTPGTGLITSFTPGTGLSGDVLGYATLEGIAAQVSIAAGELERAEQLARSAIASLADLEPAPNGLGTVVAELRTTLGVALREGGRFDEARVELEQAAALWTEHYGEHHPIVASVRFELALLDHREGRHEAAVVELTRVVEVYERAYGANSLAVARASAALAVILGELGRHQEALRRHQQARAIFRANLDEVGAATVELARVLDNEGVIRRELGQLDEALLLHQRALGLLEGEPAVGVERAAALDRGNVSVHLGEVLLALDRVAEAREVGDAACELLVNLEYPGAREGLARARFVAARAWASGDESELGRARALARQARGGFVDLGDREAVDEVDRWLAALG